MTTRIEVTSSKVQNGQMQFICNNEELSNDTNLEASGQVLVDSDALSFIYILETDESFIYVSFPKERWHDLKMVIEEDKQAYMYLTDEKAIQLDQLKDELEYLIENIAGNANYGSEMMNSVEEVFLPIKQ